MALVRCETHGRPRGRKHDYVTAVRPIGYPKSAAICGSGNCVAPGLVWLTEEEDVAYRAGERVFPVPNAAVKIYVI